jgi:hypothetical protein
MLKESTNSPTPESFAGIVIPSDLTPDIPTNKYSAGCETTGSGSLEKGTLKAATSDG